MKLSNLYLIIVIVLTSCLDRNESTNSTNESIVPNHIVLIFKDFPKEYSINLNDTKNKAHTPAKPHLTYYDDHLIQRILKPMVETHDTIVLACNQKQIELRHSVKGFDKFDYIFKKGDTILFSYVDKIPTAKVINRVTSDFEINYDQNLREIVLNNDYPALTKITLPFMFITYNADYIRQEGERSGILGQIDRVKSAAQLRFKKEADLELNFLDSLLNNSLLSKDSYGWFRQKIKIKKATEKAFNDVLSRSDIKTMISSEADSLLYYHSYRYLITTVSSTFYERKTKRIITSNSNLPDYKIAYDSINQSNLFSNRTKEILLFETSNHLIQNNRATEVATHIERIKNDIKDTLLISYLVNKYELTSPLSTELQLMDLNRNQTTLTAIIKENSNTVVYVDLWASWCGPCIDEFKQSKILAEKLKNKNVRFIYLSIDDDVNKWINSSSRNNLPDQYSFLIINKNTTKFLESIDFTSIPRYLIFNKAGELEYEDAPRPSNPQTIKLLEALVLSEEHDR